MNKLLILLVLTIVFPLSACTKSNNRAYEKYTADLFNYFDTHIQFICYAKSRDEFEGYVSIIESKLSRLNEYFDIYNTYDGINNLKTINDNAGIVPVQVSDEIIALMKLAKQAYGISGKTVNAAMGSVLAKWHSYREKGLKNPDLAELPAMSELEDLALYADIEKVLIDEENKTIFLEQPGMSLDVGAIAKGFAAQLTADAARQHGIISCLLNMGGNIAAVGRPMENTREYWNIGIQDPANPGDLLDVIYGKDISAVTSGDYMRYYVVDSVRYNHIINPSTLMPAVLHRSVTVIHEDSGMAEILSTALFILPYEEGFKIAEEYNAAVIWVMNDMTVKTNERYNAVSKNYGS